MDNFIKDLIKRVKADWQEWNTYQRIAWVERFRQRRALRDNLRDKRMIDAAIERAKIKNASDNRTYYILRDRWGGINEINSRELALLTRRKVFKKMNYMERLNASIAIITSNRYTQKDFDRIQRNKNKSNEQHHQGTAGS